MSTLYWIILLIVCSGGSAFIAWTYGMIIGHGEGVICKPCKTHRACPKCGKTSFMA